MTLRTLVVGAGAIGGYFGGRMLEAGGDVTFLVRPRRAAQLAADGLVVRSGRGDLRIAAPTVTAEALGGRFDAVVLSCKAFDLEGAMAALAPAVGPDTKILPLLNGIRHLDVLAARFGDAAVLGGQCQISTTLEADGTVRQFGDMQALSLGERDGRAPSPVTRALAEALTPAGGRLSDTIMQEMWEKWVFITTIAATTCLMRATIGDVVAAGASDVPLGIASECAAIAERCGFAPRPAAMERLRGVVTSAGSPLTASMLRDVERGGPVEVEHVMGDLLARGAEGASPLLRVACLQLRAYEARRVRESLAAGA